MEISQKKITIIAKFGDTHGKKIYEGSTIMSSETSNEHWCRVTGEGVIGQAKDMGVESGCSGTRRRQPTPKFVSALSVGVGRRNIAAVRTYVYSHVMPVRTSLSLGTLDRNTHQGVGVPEVGTK